MTLAVLYYVYVLFVLIFLAFTFFNVYHLIRFGFLTVGNVSIITIYVIGSILILMVSWGYIGQIDWNVPLQLYSAADSQAAHLPNL